LENANADEEASLAAEAPLENKGLFVAWADMGTYPNPYEDVHCRILIQNLIEKILFFA
jgi:hypothetical protein